MNKLNKVDWNQVLARDAYEFQITPKKKWKYVARGILTSLNTQYDIPVGDKVDFLCFRSLVRDDYKNLFEIVIDTIDSPKKVVQDFSREPSTKNIRFLVNFVTRLKLFFVFRAESLLERLYLYQRICTYLVVLQQLENIAFTKLLVFADMQPLDNLLCQYFDHKTTMTLQHGLYVDYATQDTINTANYLHQPAKYFLSWGEDTKKLINRYNPERQIAICGKPNLQEARTISDAPDRAFFTVIFDQNIFHKYNEKLLDIAYGLSERINLSINLRLHPWNNRVNYRIDPDRLVENQLLVNSKFVIGHTTSMIYELLRVGVPAFKLKSEEPSLATPEIIQFTNVEDLVDLYKRIDQIDFEQLGCHYITYCGEESLKCYRDFFSKLPLSNSNNPI